MSQTTKDDTREGWCRAVCRTVAPPRETPISAKALGTRRAERRVRMSSERVERAMGGEEGGREERPRVS